MEEVNLKDLRRILGLTQAQLANIQGINPENISRIENKNDMMLSRLNSYIDALGGELILTVHLDGKAWQLVL